MFLFFFVWKMVCTGDLSRVLVLVFALVGGFFIVLSPDVVNAVRANIGKAGRSSASATSAAS